MTWPEEKHFLEAFIRKSRRERLCHELEDPKKRHRGLDRFSHTAKDLLRPEKIRLQGEAIEKEREFRELIASCKEPCLLLSSDQETEGIYLPLPEAAASASSSMEAVLILGSSFALVYGEPMKGGREKYLLLD